MKIELEGVGKRYKMEWILRGIDLSLQSGGRYAITGPNGSGKSTLMKMLSGYLTPSKGKITFIHQAQALPNGDVYKHLSYAAPYIDLIEAFTLWEAIRFHQRFQSFRSEIDAEGLYQLLGFKKARRKQIRHFSSGMKQRLKLALAFCSDTPLLLLDEPTTNLGTEGIRWYQQLMERYAPGRTLLVASNAEVDFDGCEERINVLQYKKKP